MRPGTNTLVIAIDAPINRKDGPPDALLACLEIRYDNGAVNRWSTDQSWPVSASPSDYKPSQSDDATTWSPAVALGLLGDDRWGAVGDPNPFDGPQSAGIPGQLRFIWVPHAEPIQLHELEPNSEWAASWFDPTDCERRAMPPIVADANGTVRLNAPAGPVDDWGLILERIPHSTLDRQE